MGFPVSLAAAPRRAIAARCPLRGPRRWTSQLRVFGRRGPSSGLRGASGRTYWPGPVQLHLRRR
eukprot:16940-Alexandrium_andersonii.AAC.1